MYQNIVDLIEWTELEIEMNWFSSKSKYDYMYMCIK